MRMANIINVTIFFLTHSERAEIISIHPFESYYSGKDLIILINPEDEVFYPEAIKRLTLFTIKKQPDMIVISPKSKLGWKTELLDSEKIKFQKQNLFLTSEIEDPRRAYYSIGHF